MMRLGSPRDMFGILLFLASDEARYITGQNRLVDGEKLLFNGNIHKTAPQINIVFNLKMFKNLKLKFKNFSNIKLRFDFPTKKKIILYDELYSSGLKIIKMILILYSLVRKKFIFDFSKQMFFDFTFKTYTINYTKFTQAKIIITQIDKIFFIS